MKDLNERRVLGFLGRDPVQREMTGGKKVVNFSVATSDRYTDKATGEIKEFTEWHRVTVFNQAMCALVMDRLHAGSLVMVQGQHRSREFKTKDDLVVREGEIVIRPFDGEIFFLDSDADEQLAAMARNGFPNQPKDYEIEPAGNGSTQDEEIPF